MGRVACAVVLAVAAAFSVASGQASAAGIGCFGPPAEYRTYVDQIDTGRGNGQADYPEVRWYDEQQNWATPAADVAPFYSPAPGHHSEHIHVGACVPNGMTMTAPFRLDVEYTFHHVVDYDVTKASMAAVTQTGSDSLYLASVAQLAELEAAMDSSATSTVKVIQSYTVTAPPNNGFKEIRGGIDVVKSGPTAVFDVWKLDGRWYETDSYTGLPASTPFINQLAVRNRALVSFIKPGTQTLGQNYHHSGWYGYGACPADATTLAPSRNWTGIDVARRWTAATKTVCLYVTDGGGPAFLEIDPNHHAHDPTSPDGENHGVWYWQPDNARQEIFSGANQPQFVTVTIPVGSLSLGAGVHRLVFTSTEVPECQRANNPCPPDIQGTWTNVSVLPFRVQ